MPRPFSNNLRDLLKLSSAKGSLVEEHTTLELTTTGLTAPPETYRIATASLTISGISYTSHLRDAGVIKESITNSQNWNEALIENVSALFGPTWLNRLNEIQGAKVKIGRYWRDLETGQEYHEILFRGVVQRPQVDQNSVKLQSLSDIDAASIGGGRRVARKCQFKFRDPLTCGYSGVETTCNKLFNSPGGCSGRNNQHHYGGFIFIQPPQP
jgi:hypothetical protein